MAARFTKFYPIYLEPEMFERLAEAAEQQLVSGSSYARTAIAERLRRDGYEVRREQGAKA